MQVGSELRAPDTVITCLKTRSSLYIGLGISNFSFINNDTNRRKSCKVSFYFYFVFIYELFISIIFIMVVHVWLYIVCLFFIQL